MVKAHILVIEDSKDYQLIIEATLKSEFNLTFANTGHEALQCLRVHNFDLVLIDVVLPDMSGLQICEFLKSQNTTQNTPAIMLTSKDSVEDRIHGYERGADDYINKPFHSKELLTRVRSKINKSKSSQAQQILIPGLEIDLQKQRIWSTSENRQLHLTGIEFRMFLCFAQRIDHVLSREQILDIVWPNNLSVSERTIDSHISNLRRKLAGLNMEINAVHSCGYRFVLKEVQNAA